MLTISFKGRFNRKQFWGGTLMSILLILISVFTINLSPIIFAIMSILTVIYGFSVSVRRGHDLGMSGWMLFLINCIPVVHFFLFIYLGFFKGDPNENKYDD